MERNHLFTPLVGGIAAAVLAAACADQPTAPEPAAAPENAVAVAALDCRAVIATRQLTCGETASGSARRAVVGGQGTNVRLTSSNLSSAGGVFSFDVTVQNLLPEAMGTPDGLRVDTAGISVFFASGPTVTGGTGSAAVANADGAGDFTADDQPYFRWNEKLAQGQVSSPRTWRIAYDPGVTAIGFRVYVRAELQPLLVINELMANPGGSIAEAAGEWFEVYNAGRFPVQMQGMVIADSAAAGRRPYHRVAAALVVQPGAYATFGENANTTSNGGVPVDYVYGGALSLANTLDAVKVARVYGTDTLTLDRAQYATAPQDGVSRELKNPALDNASIDGGNWADALATAVYGPGGRGTPKARNSTYTP